MQTKNLLIIFNQLRMLKKIWMPFLALSILGTVVGCSSDVGESNDVQNKNSIVLKSNMTVRSFSLTHCLILREVSNIYIQEIEAGGQLNENIITQARNATTPAIAIQILTRNGVSSGNATRIVTLLGNVITNYNNFVSSNPAFSRMDANQQESIISKGINDLIIENPGNLFPPAEVGSGNETLATKCRLTLNSDLRTCFNYYCVTAGVALVLAPWTGGLSLIGAALGGWASAAVCEQGAYRNFRICNRPD